MNFSWPVRVYYEDTDSGGVVYYANYLKFMERARTEFLRQLGFEQDQLIKENNIVFAVRSVQLDYKLPARFNDELMVTANLLEMKRASMLFEHKITKNDSSVTVLCEGTIRIACLQADRFKPCAIPDAIMEVARVD